ncbi:tannase and feruloyl esterase [Penicillium alfredii]|uniref:Carboxylic ester hydrolase n=1 Tax=Penicillium alfredii TaxID=1506179 RepID=A0A9W9G948_9EURO|nr:tannase and feruloyl esterase [Penicillium alfredii]KAJ5114244.1 tannase and feruloyl esterase [Penicillium alfredii]
MQAVITRYSWNSGYQYQRSFRNVGSPPVVGGLLLTLALLLSPGMSCTALPLASQAGASEASPNSSKTLFCLPTAQSTVTRSTCLDTKPSTNLLLIGKAFTKRFFGVKDKLYAYYQGCSEGGREGWSQVQRYATEWDGAVIGAPAMRYGQQQVNHLYPDVVEHTLGYYPHPCELEKIMNLTITACDTLDGRKDGVVARTDLCKLHFNINSTIGAHYSCAASSSTTQLKKRVSLNSTTPAQNGTMSLKGAAVASKMPEGLHTLDRKRAYIWYQPTAAFDDAQTRYNSKTGKWGLDITSLGGEWTTMPDLTAFQAAGGKILTVHGESDSSIPAGSSVHYHESVRRAMYPESSYQDGSRAMADCDGPFPQTTLETLIAWVEKGQAPDRLNATVLQGQNKGEKQQLCT